MQIFGKTIRLFLVEGTANGLVTAELSNWTGKAFKLPKIKVKEYVDRPELGGSGVYILFGKNEKNEDAAYVGEGEPVYKRLLDHLAKKDFWNEVIVFVSKDDYLNKASIKYLENRLYKIGKQADRYDISNDNTPTLSSVSEAEVAELEEFLSNIKLLTSTLGHRIFEEVTVSAVVDGKAEEILFCKSTTGASASGSPSAEGFIVYKDSEFSIVEHPSLSDSIRQEKKKMLADGILKEAEGKLVLSKHYTFNSSSRAAAMITGRSASGPIEWKTKEGVQLKKLLE